jgi:hypothetical protein
LADDVDLSLIARGNEADLAAARNNRCYPN